MWTLCVQLVTVACPAGGGGGAVRRWSGAAEAFKSPTSVAALTGALFGRSLGKPGAGAVQLPTRSQRPTPEDQV